MNQPNFCYVLTTTGRDVFADMTYASVAFLRYAHPEAEIICLCDAASHRALEAARHPLLEVVDRAVPVETPDESPGYRNRFVKTQMRQILKGDFVYFDADTLVVDRIDEMLTCRAPLAGIANHSGSGDASEIGGDEVAVFEVMGWQLPRRPYINGGVLLLRDCEQTRCFSDLWHEKWLAWSLRGRHTDQPSLNSALADSGIDYEVLGSRFNGQVNQRPSLCREPVAVWHFYFSQSEIPNQYHPRTMMDEAITCFRANGRLSPDAIRELRAWPYPWRTPTMLDRCFVRRRVVSRDDLAGHTAARCWLAGYRRKAVMLFLAGQYQLLKRQRDNRAWRAMVQDKATEQETRITGP